MTDKSDTATPLSASARGGWASGDTKPFEKFLNPQSMLTPGICGLLTVGITNSLAQNFDAPRAWVGLGVSMLFGAIVFIETRRPIERIVYYVLNTLIIFSMAFGVASAPEALSRVSNKTSAFVFIGPARAQAADGASRIGGAADRLASECNVPAKSKPLSELGGFCGAYIELYKANPAARSFEKVFPSTAPVSSEAEASALKAETKRFFSPWKF